MVRVPRWQRVAAGIAWALAVALALHFLWIAQLKYSQVDPSAYGMIWSRRGWLWMHLAGGALAMLLGALQFIAHLRNRWPRVHRWTGRLYLLAMLIGITGASGLVATSPAPAAIRIAFAATGIAWVTTAVVGFVAIRRKCMDVHPRWMIRNYLVTLAPATFRLALLLPGVMALASPIVMIPVLLWLSWMLPLLAYEVIRRTRRE